MKVKTTSKTNAKPQAVFTDDGLMISPITIKTVTAFVDRPSEWNTTGTVTPLENFTETASLLTSKSMSTIIDKKVAVRVTSKTETPYLMKRNTQIGEFSVVTPEQANFIYVYTAILSMIPEGDPDLTAYFIESPRTNKPEQQSNRFWFPTPNIFGKIEVHTPIQTRIFKELY